MKKCQLFCFEGLENRQLFTAGISYDDGVMTITGTVAPDSITVSMRDQSSDNLGYVYFNRRRFAIQEVVDEVNINSLDGSDKISVSAMLDRSRDPNPDPPERILINIVSDKGNDRVSVSSDQEVFVDSGSGNDTVRMNNRGPTEVFGGDGNDVITLSGNVFGTDEFDFVAYGEDGDDRLYSRGTMTHILDGGEGNNRLYGSNGTTFYTVGASPEAHDIISGGSGDDIVRALGIGFIKFTGGRNGDDQFVMSQSVYRQRSAYPGLTILGPNIEIVIE